MNKKVYISLFECSLLYYLSLALFLNILIAEPTNLNEFYIGDTEVNINLKAESGYYDDQGLYASFGLEKQIYKFSKIVIPVKLKNGNWFGEIEYAPLYDGLRKEFNKPFIAYGEDSQGREINGNNPYFDWYKNGATQIYNPNDADLLNAFIGFRFNDKQSIYAGRMKAWVGLPDDSFFWQDDAKFSPMAHWYTRDLLTGVLYQYDQKQIFFNLGLWSGDNSMKGYSNYLDGIENANLKGNNTPTVSANLHFKLGNFFHSDNDSKIYAGVRIDEENSTYFPSLKDGKRRDNSYVAGVVFDFIKSESLDFNVFAQYTKYESGLDENSSQYDPSNPIFYNIDQECYFLGTRFKYKKIEFSYTYEEFDRFDFNVYEKYNYSRSFDLLALKQESHIFGIRYHINKNLGFEGSYHKIDNPLQWVSDILDNRSDNRYKLALIFNF